MKKISKDSALLFRYLAWSEDRFPFANVISGFLSFFTMISVGRYLSTGGDFQYQFLDLLGGLAFTTHLLLLRVFDEHKDYHSDLINYPLRVLSQNIITLKDLRLLAYPLPFIAILWSFLAGNAIITWLIVMIYSVLMFKEFFIGEWLNKNLLIYSVSHMIVSPLMIYWIIAAGAQNYTVFHPQVFIILLISLTGGLSYEFTRKTRGTDESEKLESFNKLFGFNGAVIFINLMNLVSFIFSIMFIQNIGTAGVGPLIVLGIGYICTFYPNFNFAKKKTEKARKLNEGGLGLFFLGLYSSIIYAVN